MGVGRHLIVDVGNINDFELLNYANTIQPLMEKIIRDCNLR